jgi:hypothetical protein
VKIKAKVKGKLPTRRMCLEIGKDLTRVQLSINMFHIAIVDARANPKEIAYRALLAARELERLKTRFPLTSSRVEPVEKSLRKIAAANGNGKTEQIKKAVESAKSTLAPLFAEADKSCGHV